MPRKMKLIGFKKGRDGATFTPTVSEDGTISWTNDKGHTNPEPVLLGKPRFVDDVTGVVYTLKVSNGKLIMEEV